MNKLVYLLALLITGCSAVHVRDAPVEVPAIRAASASLPDDERHLVTSAEAHLSKALAAERKQMRRAAEYHYLEAARLSYGHMQMRDLYNFATERVASRRLKDTHGELIPASRLKFDGVGKIYRRDGFGAAFVSVQQSQFRSVTVVLRFPGETLEVYDPYRDETAQLGGRVVPLAANFTAAYALWLSRSQFRREAGRALLWRAPTLDAPRIYAMQPYDPQRRIIVLIHGLASGPDGWVNLVNEIMGDEDLRRRYQVWQVFYPTNLPIPENVRNIRAALLDELRKLDPPGTANASRHMTLIGHSMGGVIARLLVVDSQDGLWQTIFEHPVDSAQRQQLAVLEPYLTLSPLPQVDRAIFLASPHRGSPMAHAWIGRVATRLVRLPASMLHTLGSVADAIATELPLQADTLRHRQLSSVAYLSDQDRYLRATSALPIAAGVTYHSIIGSNDEVVPYTSSHLDGAASEQLVTSGHSVQQTEAAIRAIQSILRD